VNEFDFIKGADALVQQDIANWEEKIANYVSEFFDNEVERVYGTQFGDSIAIIADIAENATTEPETFRGVRDRSGRLQAAAIVHQQSDYLEVDFIATAPWNLVPDRSESIKGAGTALMEELVKESLDLGNGGRLKLYAIPRARQFYERIGLEETESGDWELSPQAAERFLERLERRRRM
jgi:GNAT superfamily N-acetyltransferase